MAYENRFYLLPFDMGYNRARARVNEAGVRDYLHSISDRELEEGMEGVDAGHIVMVLDACQIRAGSRSGRTPARPNEL